MSACRESVEFHVRQLGHIVDLVRGVQTLGEGRQGALRLRVQLMGLAPQDVFQIVPVVRGRPDGFPQRILVLFDDFTFDEA